MKNPWVGSGNAGFEPKAQVRSVPPVLGWKIPILGLETWFLELKFPNFRPKIPSFELRNSNLGVGNVPSGAENAHFWG